MIAFLIVIYLMTLVWDLLPARHTYGLTKAAVLRHQGTRDLLPTSSSSSPPASPTSPLAHSPLMRQASGQFDFARSSAQSEHGFGHDYAETAFEPLPMGYGQDARAAAAGRSRETSFASSVGGEGYKVAVSERWEDRERGVGYP